MFSSVIIENVLHSPIELLCTLIKVHSTVYFWALISGLLLGFLLFLLIYLFMFYVHNILTAGVSGVSLWFTEPCCGFGLQEALPITT